MVCEILFPRTHWSKPDRNLFLHTYHLWTVYCHFLEIVPCHFLEIVPCHFLEIVPCHFLEIVPSDLFPRTQPSQFARLSTINCSLEESGLFFVFGISDLCRIPWTRILTVDVRFISTFLDRINFTHYLGDWSC